MWNGNKKRTIQWFFFIFAAFFLFGPFRIFFYQKKFLSHCFSKSQIFVLLGSTGSYSKDQDSLVKKKINEIRRNFWYSIHEKTQNFKIKDEQFSENKIQFSHFFFSLNRNFFSLHNKKISNRLSSWHNKSCCYRESQPADERDCCEEEGRKSQSEKWINQHHHYVTLHEIWWRRNAARHNEQVLLLTIVATKL